MSCGAIESLFNVKTIVGKSGLQQSGKFLRPLFRPLYGIYIFFSSLSCHSNTSLFNFSNHQIPITFKISRSTEFSWADGYPPPPPPPPPRSLDLGRTSFISYINFDVMKWNQMQGQNGLSMFIILCHGHAFMSTNHYEGRSINSVTMGCHRCMRQRWHFFLM